MARTGSCHFESVSTQAERGSYGEWQELVLAILEMARTNSCHLKMARTGSCHFKSVSTQAERGSYGEWQEPVLAIFKVCRHQLNWVVMGSGKNRFLPFS